MLNYSLIGLSGADGNLTGFLILRLVANLLEKAFLRGAPLNNIPGSFLAAVFAALLTRLLSICPGSSERRMEGLVRMTVGHMQPAFAKDSQQSIRIGK